MKERFLLAKKKGKFLLRTSLLIEDLLDFCNVAYDGFIYIFVRTNFRGL